MKKTILIVGTICMIFLVGLLKKVSLVFKGESAQPVKVVSVSNVDMGQINYMESGMYGMVTSRVSQNISLEPDYKIEKIFVKKDQHVKEGEPLFSYDMTLEELKLEIAKLKLQTEELRLQKLEKELKKMGGVITAQVTRNTLNRTMSSNIINIENSNGLDKTIALNIPSEKSDFQMEEFTSGNEENLFTDGNIIEPLEAVQLDIVDKQLAEEFVDQATEKQEKQSIEISAEEPTEVLAEQPTEAPTEAPAEQPTEAPTEAPAEEPTEAPTEAPAEEPTEAPTEVPVELPTETPTEAPTEQPTEIPTDSELLPDEEVVKNMEQYWKLASSVLQDSEQPLEQLLKNSQKAINIYQKWLSKPEIQEEIFTDNLVDTQKRFDIYKLTLEVKNYLKKINKEEMITKLSESYKEICIQYVLKKTTLLNIDTLKADELKQVMELYEQLGYDWKNEIELRWIESNRDPNELDKVIPTMADTLRAYDVTLKIRELSPDTYEENLLSYLTALRDYYLALPEEARSLVVNSEEFISFLNRYGLWEEENPGVPDIDDPGWDSGEVPEYTEEERKEMIKEKEQEMAVQRLDVREAALAAKAQQDLVNKKIVKSTIDGIVMSIGTKDGIVEGDYFAKITNTEGKYVKGMLDEFSKERLRIGDTIQGTSFDTGIQFSAVIKEISEYPDTENNSEFSSFGVGNGNTSYYPFYAIIEGEEGVEDGTVELKLSETSGVSNVISLEQYFIRTEKNGKKYVMKRGKDGKLCRQTVETGITNGSMVEILKGLTLEDWIAFPYGKNVVEGAVTEETDSIYEQ